MQDFIASKLRAAYELKRLLRDREIKKTVCRKLFLYDVISNL